MKKFLLLCFSFVIALSALAQERVVSGKVTSSEDGSTLPGVNVVLKGTTNGTVTDVDGNYRLTVPATGGSLVFSFIGLQTQEVAIGERSTVDIGLGLDVQQLSEVVVTSLGLEREKKALGYSVASVSGSAMQQRSEPDPLRALQGKMPGVNITGSGGAPGQSTRINIRGFSSLTGNTQPLFIVDGIPFDNGVNDDVFGAARGTQFSNRAFDLDPNNIESITVLKGAAAAALYGSRATNGVVVVTTKAGKKGSKKGLEVSFNSSMNFEEISGLPDYQDVYTQGSNQNYNGGFIGNWGAPFPEYVDQLNQQYHGGTQRYSKTYSPGYPEGTVPHPITGNGYGIGQGYQAAFPELMATTDVNGNGSLDDPLPVVLRPYDIVGGFFNTGRVFENALTVSSSNDKVAVSGGVSRMTNEGIVPNSEAGRTSINFGGSGQLDNGLFISGSMTYVNTTQQTPNVGPSIYSDYSGGSEGSLFSRLFYLPRNYDLNSSNPEGIPYPSENPINGNNVFYRALDNPIWTAKYNLYNSTVNRAYGNMTFGYDIQDWLNVTFKGGVNTYSEARRSITRAGGASIPAGQIFLQDLNNLEMDYNLIFTVTKDINEDISFRGIFGGNANERQYSTNADQGTDFIVPGLYTLRNTATQVNLIDYKRLRRLIGAYADLSFSYKKYLNLSIVMRNDWASTLPEQNRSFFYPGASLAFVITDATDALDNIFSLAKVRAAYTIVGREADPYLTNTVYSVTTPLNGGFSQGVYRRATLGNTVGNLDLVNETTKELEFGGEFRTKNDRIGLDITWFKRNSLDQIIPVRVSPSSGFTSATTNVGEIENRGWEIGLTATVLKLTNGFQWDLNAAYTRIRSEVLDAGPAGELLIGGVGGGNSGVLQNVHRKGQPYAQIYGTSNARDEEGNLLIQEATGLPYTYPDAGIIGNPLPDFTLGVTNTFMWKGITLSALLDWKQGGDFYSVTAASLFLRGQLASQLDREGLRTTPGVYGDPADFTTNANGDPVGVAILDENGQKVPNSTSVSAFDYHFSDGFGAYGADEVSIYDGTTIRLREISLGYSLPKNILSKTPFGTARFSVSGRNLWWKAPNVLEGLNLDPEVLATTADSNVQGFEVGATPTTRRYGFNLYLTF
jgi:TonB-linked SusC/RagA family outer membrane protein